MVEMVVKLSLIAVKHFALKICEEAEVYLLTCLTSALDGENGQLDSPAPLPPGKRLPIYIVWRNEWTPKAVRTLFSVGKAAARFQLVTRLRMHEAVLPIPPCDFVP